MDRQSFAYHLREVRRYRASSRTLSDFMALMRLRLSRGGFGRLFAPFTAGVTLNGLGSVRLRSHTSDIAVLAELLLGGEFDALPRRDARVIVDLGANTGLAYCWLRHRYPRARFVCVEPAPGNLEILRANAGADCDVVAACVGARERQVALVTPDGDWSHQMVDNERGNVDVVTMPQLIDLFDLERIDVLKCDIEGAEAELFADCSAWINRVDTMIIETHEPAITAGQLIASVQEADPHLAARVVSSNDSGQAMVLFVR
jgi:FkbM family methyltransferase